MILRMKIFFNNEKILATFPWKFMNVSRLFHQTNSWMSPDSFLRQIQECFQTNSPDNFMNVSKHVPQAASWMFPKSLSGITLVTFWKCDSYWLLPEYDQTDFIWKQSWNHSSISSSGCMKPWHHKNVLVYLNINEIYLSLGIKKQLINLDGIVWAVASKEPLKPTIKSPVSQVFLQCSNS